MWLSSLVRVRAHVLACKSACVRTFVARARAHVRIRLSCAMQITIETLIDIYMSFARINIHMSTLLALTSMCVIARVDIYTFPLLALTSICVDIHTPPLLALISTCVIVRVDIHMSTLLQVKEMCVLISVHKMVRAVASVSYVCTYVCRQKTFVHNAFVHNIIPLYTITL